jgi:hypothetical protein
MPWQAAVAYFDKKFLADVSNGSRPTCSAFGCLLPLGADMVREKASMRGRTFRLDTSAGFGKPGQHAISSPTLAHCRSRPRPRPRRSYERPAWAASKAADDGTPTRSLVERPAGVGPGTRPRQVLVGDQRLGCDAVAAFCASAVTPPYGRMSCGGRRSMVCRPRLNAATGLRISAIACSGVSASKRTTSAGLPTARP